MVKNQTFSNLTPFSNKKPYRKLTHSVESRQVMNLCINDSRIRMYLTTSKDLRWNAFRLYLYFNPTALLRGTNSSIHINLCANNTKKYKASNAIEKLPSKALLPLNLICTYWTWQTTMHFREIPSMKSLASQYALIPSNLATPSIQNFEYLWGEHKPERCVQLDFLDSEAAGSKCKLETSYRDFVKVYELSILEARKIPHHHA